ELNLLKFRLDKGPQQAQAVHVSVPFDANVPETVLSPDSNTLAWILFHQTAPSPLLKWWNSLHARKTDPANVTEIWLSNPDGTKMRKIGGIEFNDRPGGYKFAYDLRWLPDSKRISFI